MGKNNQCDGSCWVIDSRYNIPYLLSNNLVEVTGEVTQGAMSGENSNSERRIHIRDEKTGEEHSLKYWGTGSDLGDKITVRYLPHTEYGYVVEQNKNKYPILFWEICRLPVICHN